MVDTPFTFKQTKSQYFHFFFLGWFVVEVTFISNFKLSQIVLVERIKFPKGHLCTEHVFTYNKDINRLMAKLSVSILSFESEYRLTDYD